MLNIVCTTDPISGKDLDNLAALPFITDYGNETELKIYFESESNKREYLGVPLEHPTGDHSVNLDNPTDEYIDEG